MKQVVSGVYTRNPRGDESLDLMVNKHVYFHRDSVLVEVRNNIVSDNYQILSLLVLCMFIPLWIVIDRLKAVFGFFKRNRILVDRHQSLPSLLYQPSFSATAVLMLGAEEAVVSESLSSPNSRSSTSVTFTKNEPPDS